MKDCTNCEHGKMVQGRKLEDYTKKTFFGEVLKWHWVEFEERVCFSLPEPINIERRENIACSMHKVKS